MSLESLVRSIVNAMHSRKPLRLRGGGTKDFYGNDSYGEILDTRSYAGVIAYEPAELVVAARCGTPLAELEALLLGKQQFLPFEPPHFGPGATVGGCIAAGLSGPRRVSAGPLRDFVLGVTIIDGRGEVMRFGGTVMKNVAGYDISRLFAGSLGTLGLIAEVSLRVLPCPPAELTLQLELREEQALELANRLAGSPLRITASAWHQGVLSLRLSGGSAVLSAATLQIGGHPVEKDAAAAFWRDLREHQLPFFKGDRPLWRIAVPCDAPPLRLPGEQLIEWGGAQRWLSTDVEAATVREATRRAGGHATLFRNTAGKTGVFAELEGVAGRIHRKLKTAFDPLGIFCPGRLYAGL